MKIDVEKPFAKTEELRSMEAELDDVHMQLTKFTLTDDSMNKDMFERLVDTFTPVLTGDVSLSVKKVNNNRVERVLVVIQN